MTRIEQTLDGKKLPRHLKMFRDEDGGCSSGIVHEVS